MSLLTTILWGKELSPEKFAQLKAKEKWENSKEYRDLQWQNKADNEINKIIKKVLEIKEIKSSNPDKSKLLWDKFIKKQKDKNNGYLVYLDHNEKQKWGLDERSINSLKRGDTSLKIWNFNKWLTYEILKEEEIYNWFMSSRTKEDFERNGQEWEDWRYDPKNRSYKSEQWNLNRRNKAELIKEKDFNYLKFLKEQVYTPLLIEKQDKYGIYNWITEKVCHPERFKTKKTVNDDVDKQLELLKQQQAILDRQIELEKLKDRNNSDTWV